MKQRFELRQLFSSFFVLAVCFGLLRYLLVIPQLIGPVMAVLGCCAALIIPSFVENLPSRRQRIFAAGGLLVVIWMAFVAAATLLFFAATWLGNGA